MIAVEDKNIALDLDPKKIKGFRFLDKKEATETLARLWDVDVTDVSQFMGLFVPAKTKTIDENTSFITLAFNDHGYVAEPGEKIDIDEAQKQIEIDLEIINRESQWDDSEAIVFKKWWPKPSYKNDDKTLTFGVERERDWREGKN